MSPVLKISAIVLLVTLMLHVGFQIDRERLRAVLTNYGLLGRALLANCVIVPLLGMFFVWLFHLREAIAVGILLMAISPGGRGILLAGGRKKGGSLGFAATLVFLLPAVSIITVPISAHYLLPDAHISTRMVIVVIAVFQLVPLLAGMVLNERMPEVAARLDRPVLIVLLIALLVVLVPLVPAIVHSIAGVYGSLGMLAILAIVVLSVLTGWILGGPERAYRRTLGLGTALRSFAFCAVIATQSFPGTEATAAVLTYFVIQMVVTGLIGIYFQRTARTVGA